MGKSEDAGMRKRSTHRHWLHIYWRQEIRNGSTHDGFCKLLDDNWDVLVQKRFSVGLKARSHQQFLKQFFRAHSATSNRACKPSATSLQFQREKISNVSNILET